MENNSPSMKRVSMSVLASSLALLGNAASIPTLLVHNFRMPSSSNSWQLRASRSRGGFSTFVNRGLPGNFRNPPRPRKRCQRRGRR